ncbi:hypothetical protein GCM10010346_60290 [Streptomyces chryseus]|uniref:Uncharacterized protein n=1 Tax=Streptomyces chryseus TaxID=68186 RepID=A0ABQ3E8X8_9ACTN|nr:hypothetical protein GCM10010346_60290 [Streptomyces chryseus]
MLTSTGSAQAAPGGDPDIFSPAGYSAYLQEQTAATPEAKETLDGFKALSISDKKKFLDYLRDPEILKAAVDEAEGAVELADGQTVAREEVKINKDVSLVSELTERKVTPLAAAAGRDHTVTYNANTKVMGINITKMSVWVRYHAKRGAVTKVYNSGSAKQNFNPGVVLSAENARPWVASGKAHAETVWEGNLTALGGFMQVDKRQHITAAWDGSWKGSIKNA